MKNLIRKTKEKSILISSALITMFMTESVYADTIDAAMSNILAKLVDFLKWGGVPLAAWGLFEVFKSISEERPELRSKGFMLIISSIGIFFIKAILNELFTVGGMNINLP